MTDDHWVPKNFRVHFTHMYTMVIWRQGSKYHETPADSNSDSSANQMHGDPSVLPFPSM